jgi:alpha-ribazole phosphatase
MELLLVRHAEATADARGRCYGRLDVELSAEGRAQSRRLAGKLSREHVDVVVSSSLMRARATAEAIADLHGLDVTVLDDLRELDFGDLEGRTYEEISAMWPEIFERWMHSPSTVRFPNGESYADLRRRAARAITALSANHDGLRVVAVTHGGVVRAVLADALGLRGEDLFRLAIDTSSVTRLHWLNGEILVRKVNST